jgi:triosephosphate isomerase
MSQKYIIGNWKLNPKSEKEAVAIITQIKKDLTVLKYKVVICPPSLYVSALAKVKTVNIALGLQNTTTEDAGAYTGQVSVGTALPYKIQYCIVGHSESRANGDTDEHVAKKLAYVLKNKITPILCVGERERDEAHTYFAFIEGQLKSAFTGLSKKNIENTIIAYEPIWAIGKDAVRDATPEEFYEIKILIKKVLKESFGISKLVPILYGGSVTEKNTGMFLDQGHADGLLIGRASVNPKSFREIISIAKNSK